MALQARSSSLAQLIQNIQGQVAGGENVTVPRATAGTGAAPIAGPIKVTAGTEAPQTGSEGINNLLRFLGSHAEGQLGNAGTSATDPQIKVR